jgi:hypothetical protein
MARANLLRRAVKAIHSDPLPLPSSFAVFGRGPGKSVELSLQGKVRSRLLP